MNRLGLPNEPIDRAPMPSGLLPRILLKPAVRRKGVGIVLASVAFIVRSPRRARDGDTWAGSAFAADNAVED